MPFYISNFLFLIMHACKNFSNISLGKNPKKLLKRFTALINILGSIIFKKQRILRVLESIIAFYANKDRYFEIYRAFIINYAGTTWTTKYEPRFAESYWKVISTTSWYSRIINFVIANVFREENFSPEKVIFAFLCLLCLLPQWAI